MRVGRAAVRIIVPTAILLGVLRPQAPVVHLTRGSGDVAVLVRIVTDGHPVEITIPTPAHPAVRRTNPAPAVVGTAPHRAELRIAAPRRATAVPAAVPAAAPVAADAYPYADDSTTGVDPWGFTKRQCVSYVAWRLAEAGRPLSNDADHWGSAFNWADTARQLGYLVTQTPQVGAVAQWNAGESSAYYGNGSSPIGKFEAGSMGHVAWVLHVYADGSVLVAQYNGLGTPTYSTMHVRAPRFLLL